LSASRKTRQPPVCHCNSVALSAMASPQEAACTPAPVPALSITTLGAGLGKLPPPSPGHGKPPASPNTWATRSFSFLPGTRKRSASPATGTRRKGAGVAATTSRVAAMLHEALESGPDSESTVSTPRGGRSGPQADKLLDTIAGVIGLLHKEQQASLEAVSQRVERVEGSVNQVTTMKGCMEQSIAGLSGKVKGVEQQLETCSRRIEHVDNRHAKGVSAGEERCLARLASVQQELQGAAEEDRKSHKARARKLELSLEALRSEPKTLESPAKSNDDILSRLAALEQETARAAERIQQVSQQTAQDDVAALMHDLESRIGSGLREEIATMFKESQSGNGRDVVESCQSELSEFEEHVQQKFEELAEELRNVQGALTDVHSTVSHQLPPLAEQACEALTKCAEADVGLTGLRGKLEAMEGRVEQVQTDVGSLVGSLRSVEAKVSSAALDAWVREELAEITERLDDLATKTSRIAAQRPDTNGHRTADIGGNEGVVQLQQTIQKLEQSMETTVAQFQAAREETAGKLASIGQQFRDLEDSIPDTAALAASGKRAEDATKDVEKQTASLAAKLAKAVDATEGKIDSLAQQLARLAPLHNTVNDTSSRLSELDTFVNKQLAVSDDKRPQKVDELMSRVSTLERDTASADKVVLAVVERIEAAEQRAADAHAAADQAQSLVDEVAASAKQASAAAATAEGRVGLTESTLVALSNGVSQLEARAPAVGQVQGLIAQVAALDGEDLKAKVEAAVAEAQAAQEQVTSLSARLDTLTIAQLQTLQERLSSLEGARTTGDQGGAVGERVSGLETAQLDLEGQAVALAAKIEAQAAELQGVQKLVDALKPTTPRADAQIAALHDRLAALEDGVGKDSSLDARVAALEERSVVTPRTQERSEGQVAQLRERIWALEQGVAQMSRGQAVDQVQRELRNFSSRVAGLGERVELLEQEKGDSSGSELAELRVRLHALEADVKSIQVSATESPASTRQLTLDSPRASSTSPPARGEDSSDELLKVATALAMKINTDLDETAERSKDSAADFEVAEADLSSRRRVSFGGSAIREYVIQSPIPSPQARFGTVGGGIRGRMRALECDEVADCSDESFDSSIEISTEEESGNEAKVPVAGAGVQLDASLESLEASADSEVSEGMPTSLSDLDDVERRLLGLKPVAPSAAAVDSGEEISYDSDFDPSADEADTSSPITRTAAMIAATVCTDPGSDESIPESITELEESETFLPGDSRLPPRKDSSDGTDESSDSSGKLDHIQVGLCSGGDKKSAVEEKPAVDLVSAELAVADGLPTAPEEDSATAEDLSMDDDLHLSRGEEASVDEWISA